MENPNHTEDRSIGGLLAELPRHLSSLIRKEFDLLKAEMSEKMSQAGSAVVIVIVGAVLALVALNVLAAAAIAALVAWGLEFGWAALILGVVLLVVALILARSGMAGLKAKNLMPRRTVASVEKDANVMKESL